MRRQLDDGCQVVNGIGAAGHHPRLLPVGGSWPIGLEVLELNPGLVTEPRRMLRKRTIESHVTDLHAVTELLAGRGQPAPTAR